MTYWVGPLVSTAAATVGLLVAATAVGVLVLAVLPWPARRAVGRFLRSVVGLD